MDARVDLPLNEVLSLTLDERSALVVGHLDSIEGEDSLEAAIAWREEVLRRRSDLRAGRTQALPWAKARTRLNAL